MSSEPEKINPYASPAAESDPSFRDMLKDQRAAILFERRRRSAICMLIGCCGVILATLLTDISYRSTPFTIFAGTGTMLTSIGVFFFGQTVWTWIHPIRNQNSPT